MALLAVVAVGLLARSPATTAPPMPTESPEVVAEDPLPAPGGRGGASLAVSLLDQRTLQTEVGGLTALAEVWSTSAGEGQLLLADQLDGGARVRQVDAAADPSSWVVEGIDPVEDLVWLGERDGTLVWVRRDGVIRVRVPGAVGANRTLALPPDRRPVDARLLDGHTLAILTAPGTAGPATATVLDLGSHVTVLELPLDDDDPQQDLAHAWDLDAGLLLTVSGGRVVAVDLRGGTTTSTALPAPTARAEAPQLRTRWTISAIDGLVAVSGVDEVRLPGGRGDTRQRPYGVASLRVPTPTTGGSPGLRLLGHLDDRTTARAVVVAGDRVLALPDGPGGQLLDAGLSEVQQLPGDRQVLDVQVAADLAYVTTGSGAGPDVGPDRLTALAVQSGRVEGARDLGPDVVGFIAVPTLLITAPGRG